MRVAAAALVLLLVLLAGGCGSGGEGPAATAAPAQGPAGSQGTQSQPGGEKSIEEFGAEATGADRAHLLGSFRSYLRAIAGRDYAAACRYLSTAVQASLRQLVARPGRRPGCAAILPSLLTPAAAAAARGQLAGRVTRARAEGDRGFVVFHAPGAKLYQQTMSREGGSWKADTVVASVLVPSPATLGR